ncbi:hypothetical protein E3P77_02926, partial [Wallemia ichthyophaga]
PEKESQNRCGAFSAKGVYFRLATRATGKYKYFEKVDSRTVDEIIESNQKAYESRKGKGLGLGFEIGDYDMQRSVSQMQEKEDNLNDVSVVNSTAQDRSMSADSVPTLISDSDASFSTDESMAITPDKHVNKTIRPVEKQRPVTISLHPNNESKSSSESEDDDEKEELQNEDDEVLDGHDLANFYRSHSRQTTPTSPTPTNNQPFKFEQESAKEDNVEEQETSIYTSFVAARRSKWLDKRATITRSLSIQTPSKPTAIEQSKPIKVTIEEEDEEEADDDLNWLGPLIEKATPVKKNRPPPIWAQFAKVKGLTTDDNSGASKDVHSVLDRPRPRTSSYAFGSGTVKTDSSRKCSEKTSVVAMKKTPRKPDARELFKTKSKDEQLPFPSSYASLPMGPMPSVDRKTSSSTDTFERMPKDARRSITPTEIVKTRVSKDPTVRLVGHKHGVDLSRHSSTATMPLMPESQALRDLENMLVAYTEDEVLMRLSNMFQA